MAVVALCWLNVWLGFRLVGGNAGISLLVVLDLAAIGLLWVATQRLASAVVGGVALVLLPLLYYWLPGGDSVGRPWAILLGLSRLGVLAVPTALAWRVEQEARWRWAACGSVGLPLALIGLLAISNALGGVP